MPSTTEIVRRSDGAPDLLVRHWPAVGRPWAAMLIVHGIAEHSGRYERTGAAFAAAGIDVTAFDLRGNGGSGGRRAYVDRWSDYLDDVQDRLAAVRMSAGGLPVVLLGHSLGGFIGLDYATSGRPVPDLLILSSPALDSTLPGWKRALARVLSRLAPTLRIDNALSGDQLTSDPAVGERYFADPLVVRTTTGRLGGEALAAQKRVRQALGRLAIPTLVTHGTDDTIVPPSASAPLTGLPGVRRIAYPGLRHETLNEPTGLTVVADMVAWLRDRVAAGAPGPAEPGTAPGRAPDRPASTAAV